MILKGARPALHEPKTERVLCCGQIDVAQNKEDREDPNERVDFVELPSRNFHDGVGD